MCGSKFFKNKTDLHPMLDLKTASLEIKIKTSKGWGVSKAMNVSKYEQKEFRVIWGYHSNPNKMDFNVNLFLWDANEIHRCFRDDQI